MLVRAAGAGDTSVFINLGYAYDVGRGVRKSKRRALHWYRQALRSGEGTAAHNIGTVFRDRGETLRAARWFRKAIDHGESGSNLDLGQLVFAGLGQPSEALACFRAVGTGECHAVTEAAGAWAALAEEALVQ